MASITDLSGNTAQEATLAEGSSSEHLMNRRDFVRNSIATTVAAGVGVKAGGMPPPAKRKMNVLYIFSDQHREASLPGKPFSPVEAPNLDKFREQNFTMENCISNYPLCTPHRGILLSGRWPQQTGVTANGRKLAPDENALGHTFRKAGYHTGYVGKWHLDGNENHFIPKGPARQGFEDCTCGRLRMSTSGPGSTTRKPAKKSSPAAGSDADD